MMQPKRTKYRKQLARTVVLLLGNKVSYGEFGLKALENYGKTPAARRNVSAYQVVVRSGSDFSQTSLSPSWNEAGFSKGNGSSARSTTGPHDV